MTTTTQQDAITLALRTGGLVDITTTGRRTGQARRIEIASFFLDGRVVISGMPGRRGWYANLLADPRLTFHLKHGVVADLPARAVPVTDPVRRREILSRVTRAWRREAQLDRFVEGSPVIEVEFDDPTLLGG
jgi:deazaflavin-dependent oxidoreductase (nitroreductase family)